MTIEEVNYVLDQFIISCSMPDRPLEDPKEVLELLKEELNERFTNLEGEE